MDRQRSSQVENEKDNNKELSNTEFSFKYTETGGISKPLLSTNLA